MGASRKISSFRWATKFFMLYWHHETGCVSGGGMLLLFDVDTATSSRNAFRVAEEYRTEPHFARIMLLLMHIFFSWGRWASPRSFAFPARSVCGWACRRSSGARKYWSRVDSAHQTH